MLARLLAWLHTLHVRNVPPEIYLALKKRASERNTSIAAETLRLLARALCLDRLEVRELLDEIDRYQPRAREGTPSAADLIREDRDQG